MSIPGIKVQFTEKQINDTLAGIKEVLLSGRLILGEYTDKYEKAVAQLLGRKYAVSTASETAAFEISLKILDVAGKEVVFPANGFAGVLEAVYRAGGIPVLCDISIDNGIGFSVEQLKRVITRRTRCVVLQHTGGLICKESEDIVDFCSRRGIFVFEDAAHCFYSRLNGKFAGNFGIVGAFSTYATKPLTTGEGGLLVLDDDEMYKRARVLRNYGRTEDFGSAIIVDEGYSFRLTELQAVLGFVQLSTIGNVVDNKRLVANMYDSLLSSDLYDCFRYIGLYPNWYRYMILLPQDTDKGYVKKKFKENDIACPGDVYDLPIHHQPLYRLRFSGQTYPNAEEFARRHLCLPLYEDMTYADVKYVVGVLNKCL